MKNGMINRAWLYIIYKHFISFILFFLMTEYRNHPMEPISTITISTPDSAIPIGYISNATTTDATLHFCDLITLIW